MSPDRARRAALSCSHCSDDSDQAARMGLQLEDASKQAGGALTDDSAFAIGSGIGFVFTSSCLLSNRFHSAECACPVALTSCMDKYLWNVFVLPDVAQWPSPKIHSTLHALTAQWLHKMLEAAAAGGPTSMMAFTCLHITRGICDVPAQRDFPETGSGRRTIQRHIARRGGLFALSFIVFIIGGGWRRAGRRRAQIGWNSALFQDCSERRSLHATPVPQKVVPAGSATQNSPYCTQRQFDGSSSSLADPKSNASMMPWTPSRFDGSSSLAEPKSNASMMPWNPSRYVSGRMLSGRACLGNVLQDWSRVKRSLPGVLEQHGIPAKIEALNADRRDTRRQ
ncbi:hypothetical protein THAOC_34521 [Thalassiosira oceanica]|uniref:Uncharacterized protein n=1 Tax=Thalassiosira oceanica TaxID=159749 RepID=K0R3D8_THAOC|nr:hypothetical protein THAOC_34521 [Thalassiosira oceanica]|eukprot:EJK46795.1 hypothetical protein THAOC_34521 [Thalassiosira oceanica]